MAEGRRPQRRNTSTTPPRLMRPRDSEDSDSDEGLPQAWIGAYPPGPPRTGRIHFRHVEQRFAELRATMEALRAEDRDEGTHAVPMMTDTGTIPTGNAFRNIFRRADVGQDENANGAWLTVQNRDEGPADGDDGRDTVNSWRLRRKTYLALPDRASADHVNPDSARASADHVNPDSARASADHVKPDSPKASADDDKPSSPSKVSSPNGSASLLPSAGPSAGVEGSNEHPTAVVEPAGPCSGSRSPSDHPAAMNESAGQGSALDGSSEHPAATSAPAGPGAASASSSVHMAASSVFSQPVRPSLPKPPGTFSRNRRPSRPQGSAEQEQ